MIDCKLYAEGMSYNSHDISESKCSGLDTLTSGARVTTGLHVYLRKQNKQIEPAFNAL